MFFNICFVFVINVTLYRFCSFVYIMGSQTKKIYLLVFTPFFLLLPVLLLLLLLLLLLFLLLLLLLSTHYVQDEVSVITGRIVVKF